MKLNPFPSERQFDKMDCGPACLKIIAKHYGCFYSLQYFRDNCGITREGVSFSDLSYAAENIGLRTLPIKATMELLLTKIPLPCIVHWANSHFIVVYKMTKKKVFVSDPAIGLLIYSHAEFIKNWYNEEGYGAAMAIEPSGNFSRHRSDEKQERKKTIQNIISYFSPYKKSFINLFIILLFITGLQAILPFLSKAIIDIGIQSRDFAFINILIVANVVIYFTMLLSNVVRDWILLHVTSRLNIALISDYLIKLMKLPITFFETK